MKKYLLTFTLFALLSAVAITAADYPLWPLPQSVRFAADGACYLPDAAAAEELLQSFTRDTGKIAAPFQLQFGTPRLADAVLSLPAQGYQLDITPEGVAITGADAAGLRYALQTLRQLARRDEQGQLFLPCASITDAPDIHSRGAHFMLNQYPYSEENIAASRRFIDLLAALKYNLLVLQLDALPAYQSQSLAGTGHWPLEQLAELAAYAEARGFEVIPALQLGGHSVWFTSQPGQETFREKSPERADDPPSWDDTLCPSQSEGTRRLCGMIDELVEALHPARFLLGYDEMLAGDKECSSCVTQEAPMAALYARQVNAFAEQLQAHGVRAMIWSDQLLDFEMRHALYGNRLHVDGPGFAAELRRDLTLLPWYYGDDPVAFEVTDRTLRGYGFTEFLGACMCYTGNIRALAAAVRKHHWEGGIHTFWYHAKGPALQSHSTYVWNNLPVFADAMWNADHPANSDRVNRLNTVRQALSDTAVAVLIAPERQTPLLTTGNQAPQVSTANGVTVEFGAPRPADHLELPADGATWEKLYLALRCDRPEGADRWQSPTDYEGCTTFPTHGTVTFNYADGSRELVPLQYNWNIIEADPEREIFGAESVFTPSGRIEVTLLENPAPAKALQSVTVDAAIPGTIRFHGATAVSAAP